MIILNIVEDQYPKSMKTLFYQKFNSIWKKELLDLEKAFPDSVFVVDNRTESKDIPDTDIIVGGVIPVSVLKRAEKLKLVIVPFVGTDHLPLSLFRDRGIRVANSHGNAESVAERALGMILALYGKIISYHEDLKNGQWHGFWVGKGLSDTWESINGKTCSIIGAGEIGTVLARMLKAFNISVTGFKKQIISAAPPNFDRMVYDFEEAVQQSEIIVNILPLTASTVKIFSRDILNRMEGKVLINVGRGGTIDEKAMYDALKKGILKGAALDTWFSYPQDGETTGFPSKFPIHELDNIVLSPHIAGFTRQAAGKNIRQAFENLKSFLQTGNPINEVDVSSGY